MFYQIGSDQNGPEFDFLATHFNSILPPNNRTVSVQFDTCKAKFSNLSSSTFYVPLM